MRYWKFVDQGEITSVQSCSNDAHWPSGAIEIDEEEFGCFLSGLTPVIKPVRDLWKEIDELNYKIDQVNEKLDAL